MTQTYSLRPLGLGLSADDGIITAETVARIDEADAIVARARDEAARIIADAEQAREAEKRRGHAEGRAEAEAENARWLAEARADLDLRLDRIQGELADVVLASVKKIVLSFDDKTLALETVRSALAALRSEKRVQLFVAASVENDVRAALPRFMTDYPEIELIDVIADPVLAAPDVRLESELGVVSGSLDHSLADLGRLLRGQ